MGHHSLCPPFGCSVPPIIWHRVYGSGRWYSPWAMAAQAPGYAYIGGGDQNPADPFTQSTPCGPVAGPCTPGAVPGMPGSQTTVVGAGILSPVRWRGKGVFADNYALPGDIAREPNEGWWASEAIDADTGERSWVTAMSGLGAVGWFNAPLVNIGGVTIPRWVGVAAVVAGLWWLNKKKGWLKNPRRRSRRRNVGGEYDRYAAEELRLYIENDANLYRQMYQPIIKNLTRKAAAGKYNHELAVKGFMYLADEGAKRYAKEFGASLPWHEMFNVATRKAVARQLADAFKAEHDLGNYAEYVPKKYRKKNSRRRYHRRAR